ncbi:unnamed protein product [Cuscuta campestris]|uniref:Uncharacterized protein n=1 Tax=Cuscuta campestris TaxID=132261 RepID=A0A484MHI3_9ASTE|nr:unnamed protein product [Cuscuta campestris]
MDAASSSPSRERKPEVKDGVACSALRAMDEKYFSDEEEGDMDVDEENEEDDGETRGLEGEDFAQIFMVRDNVWETKNFSKWRKLNWRCFEWCSQISDYYFDIPKDSFKPRWDPRSGRPLELKMGHSLLYYDMDEPWIGFYLREACEGARVAIEFFNKENKMGTILEFVKMLRIRRGLHFYQPRGRVYFLTFKTKIVPWSYPKPFKELEASLFQPSQDKKTWYLRALREKPFDLMAP